MDQQIVNVPPKGSKDVVIFDLEGTLSNSTHRDKLFVCGSLRTWHEAMKNDTPNWEMINIYHHFKQTHIVVILTAKEVEYQNVAMGWLYKHIPKFSIKTDPVYFRPIGNKETSPDLKRQMLEHLRGQGLNPIMAFDDRRDVCKMFQEEGLQVVHYMKRF